MSGAGDDGPATPPRPLRGRHQLTRSISEFSPPVRLRQLRHHESLQQQDKDTSRHHHKHHHHRHHRRHESSYGGGAALRGDELRNESMPQTTVGALPHHGRASLDMSRSEYTTPLNVTPQMSRAGSVLVTGQDDNMATMLSSNSQGASLGNTEELLREEKEKAASRITGLKKSLGDLSTFSNTTTRRLDETYYAVLEKTSMLQNTVAAMKELAGSAQEIKDTFDGDAGEVVRDVQSQLESLGQFEDHEKRIQAMQGRIQAGRARLETLSARVDIVKSRVEGWERADLEWQERTRKRLKRIWIVISVVVAVILLLAIGARYANPPGKAQPLLDAGSGKGVNTSGEGGGLGLRLWEERKAEQDDELRFLDEL